MKKIAKLLVLLTYFLLGIATFTHATCISEVFENEDVLHLCKLAEKLYDFSYELNEGLQPGAIQSYCSSFVHHNDRDLSDCCELFYTMKLCKDIPLERDDDRCAFRVLWLALRYFNSTFIHFCLIYIKDISQDDIDFLNSQFPTRISEKMKEIASKYYRIDPSDTQQAPTKATQQAPKKSSCTIL